MKAMIAILIGLSVYANVHMKGFCKNSIKSEGSVLHKDDISFYESQGRTYAYGKSLDEGNFLKIFTKEGVETIPFDYKVMDMKEVGNQIFLLQPQNLMVLDKETLKLEGLYKTTHQYLEKKHQIAREFEVLGDQIFIAHGSFGLSVLDKKTGEITKEAIFNLPHGPNQISQATGIAISKEHIYLSYDNVTYNFGTKKRAFEGLLVLDHELNKLKALSIKQNREALHEPSLSIVDGKLYSQNLGHIYVYPTKNILKAKNFWPKRRLFKFNNESQLLGKPIIKKDKLKGCFSKYNPERDSFSAFFDIFIPKF
ncbi:hypothetical protein [Bacteriovorax sp. DB6_IX]|uniref:hypothetical protein n=1 Tax=Bacteriovorax sp. DB6_IX TaxID=1353530 RepID=UPI00038A4D23|nr:hypothetical protein [Bacteriovorax sp. DB6_IX]EQC51568.1 hypothetical protein M901_0799 [Bacteriovorax sp. DB6_IX]